MILKISKSYIRNIPLTIGSRLKIKMITTLISSYIHFRTRIIINRSYRNMPACIASALISLVNSEAKFIIHDNIFDMLIRFQKDISNTVRLHKNLYRITFSVLNDTGTVRMSDFITIQIITGRINRITISALISKNLTLNRI